MEDFDQWEVNSHTKQSTQSILSAKRAMSNDREETMETFITTTNETAQLDL